MTVVHCTYDAATRSGTAGAATATAVPAAAISEIDVVHGLGASVLGYARHRASAGAPACLTTTARALIGSIVRSFVQVAHAVAVRLGEHGAPLAARVPLLRERVGPHRWGAVVVGFIVDMGSAGLKHICRAGFAGRTQPARAAAATHSRPPDASRGSGGSYLMRLRRSTTC